MLKCVDHHFRDVGPLSRREDMTEIPEHLLRRAEAARAKATAEARAKASAAAGGGHVPPELISRALASNPFASSAEGASTSADPATEQGGLPDSESETTDGEFVALLSELLAVAAQAPQLELRMAKAELDAARADAEVAVLRVQSLETQLRAARTVAELAQAEIEAKREKVNAFSGIDTSLITSAAGLIKDISAHLG